MRGRSDYDPNPLRGVERLVIFGGIGFIIFVVYVVSRWVIGD